VRVPGALVCAQHGRRPRRRTRRRCSATRAAQRCIAPCRPRRCWRHAAASRTWAAARQRRRSARGATRPRHCRDRGARPACQPWLQEQARRHTRRRDGTLLCLRLSCAVRSTTRRKHARKLDWAAAL
jgi:hypothetical protein